MTSNISSDSFNSEQTFLLEELHPSLGRSPAALLISAATMFGLFADVMSYVPSATSASPTRAANSYSSALTILLPVFASYKALRSSDPSQLAPWLMYWVVLSVILLAESWTVFILGW